MRALTVVPGKKGSAQLSDVPEPPENDGPVLVQGMLLGVCGTDHEIASGDFGRAPQGRDRMVLGHECLGKVLEAPAETGLSPGDIVVGLVRHADPEPCDQCDAGEYDLCVNDRYTEWGVIGHDGYGAERYRMEPAYAMRADKGLGELAVLVEPTSVLAKAWEQVDCISRARKTWQPHSALVLGAGPIGMLAALCSAQRGLEVHIVDQVGDGPKPELARRLGAQYHTEVEKAGGGFDVCFECTGVPDLVLAALRQTASAGTTCLMGIPTPGTTTKFDLGQLCRQMVQHNQLVVATVTANRRHFHQAMDVLEKADHDWLSGLITRRLPLERWEEALAPSPEGIKTVLEIASH